MNDEQKVFAQEIYTRAIASDSTLSLPRSMKERLLAWYGDEAEECISSFAEFNVFFE